jgi:hypothetical protein
LSRPSSSARAITACAILSFMLPVGFSHSSFTSMAALLDGTTVRSRTIDVLPIAFRMFMVVKAASGAVHETSRQR